MDKDLQSIQEVRKLTQIAKETQLEFKYFSQEQVDKVVKAAAEAAFSESERLAKLANQETGFGIWQDKKIKNEFGSRNVYESIKNLKTVGVIDVLKNGKIVKIAEPMGVVAALIPSTNPTSTAFFKTLISLKTRNSIIASPHPKAIDCITEAMRVIDEAIVKAGAPKGLVHCLQTPTLEGTKALMHDKNVAVILATGGSPMVRAAYSSGKPAYGVGPGNVPAFIERSANYKKAVADIVTGTTFDNGTICASEQAMIVDRPLVEKVKEEAKRIGCYFVAGEEKKKLEQTVTKDGKLNAEIVGKPAVWIASYAGIKVPETTKVLVAECDKIGRDEPLSMEKLSPMLAFYSADGWLDGCHKSIELLEFGGIGHTMAIHSNDKEIIMKFALEKPAFRIVVNTPSSLGAVGYSTDATPSMTLGPGTWGGSIISENVSAVHLMNVKTLAFETHALNQGDCVNSLGSDFDSSSPLKSNFSNKGFVEKIEETLRARAGNPSVNPFGKTEKSEPAKRSNQVFGEGISEREIKEIIKNYRR